MKFTSAAFCASMTCQQLTMPIPFCPALNSIRCICENDRHFDACTGKCVKKENCPKKARINKCAELADDTNKTS